ncbi:MAG: SDR family oxidoreductase, partial [Proteobacteria bacterium]|nr:SDR family oxidoreductase [Pseudomonadota bacterium]
LDPLGGRLEKFFVPAYVEAQVVEITAWVQAHVFVFSVAIQFIVVVFAFVIAWVTAARFSRWLEKGWDAPWYERFGRPVAQALAPRIRVNAVAPGPTLRSARQSEAQFVRQTTATILGRGASPEDVAAAVRYLLEARAVTGQTLVVDGGQHLIWRTEDVSVEV